MTEWCPSSAVLLKTNRVALFVFSADSMSSKDYHRVYPLVQHQFAVELARTVNVVASTGVTLIVSSALSLSHDDAGNYVLRVLTQSADYISYDESKKMLSS